MGGYFGRVNLLNGEEDEFKLGDLISFKNLEWRKDYQELSENILVLSEDDFDNPKKLQSHTAVVSYHAIMSHFGKQRTFVPWEPTLEDQQKGVIVSPEHAWFYFFDASKGEQLKLQLNHRKDFDFWSIESCL